MYLTAVIPFSPKKWDARSFLRLTQVSKASTLDRSNVFEIDFSEETVLSKVFDGGDVVLRVGRGFFGGLGMSFFEFQLILNDFLLPLWLNDT